MTERLLTSPSLWNNVLTGTGRARFAQLLHARVAALMSGAAAVVYGGGPAPTEFAGREWWGALESRASGRVLELLPSELPLIHRFGHTSAKSFPRPRHSPSAPRAPRLSSVQLCGHAARPGRDAQGAAAPADPARVRESAAPGLPRGKPSTSSMYSPSPNSPHSTHRSNR